MTLDINDRERTLICGALRDAIEKLEETAQVNRDHGNTGSADIALELAAEFGQLSKRLL